MEALQTKISKAYWCIFKNGIADFEEAQISIGNEKSRDISWFDELLRGGLTLQEKKPLTLLITGPPGSGKTTFALELCYRLAEIKKMFSLYISTDGETNQIIQNTKSLGWEQAERSFLPFKGRKPDVDTVVIWGADKIKRWDALAEIVEAALESLKTWLGELPEEMKKSFFSRMKWGLTKRKIEKVSPSILVIDSLNIVEPKEKGEFFQQFLKIAKKTGEKIIIFILDYGAQDKEHKFWEYVCDTVIRLDYESSHEYYIRTLEIVKARYQEHVWGKHQLKIYPVFKMPKKDDPEYNQKLRRAHPYRKEGGIFIFPSIHFYLSLYKRMGPTQVPQLADTLPNNLNKILKDPKTHQKGLPEGRCTAFIGCRGGHKSHLGYLHLLHRIIKYQEKALVISLRDDEEMTKKTMERILKQQFKSAQQTINDLEKDNCLEILYYPPGYITPEEFFHRMFISVHRLKQNGKKLTVLFNSLDQLTARFPLCAKQEIFVPGIIELLTGEKVTSIFIAVEEPGQPAEQYGLLPMADLILSFHLYRFNFENYCTYLNEIRKSKNKTDKFKERIETIKQNPQRSFREEIVLEVMRFAGGQRAGAKGLLELIDEDKINEALYEYPGLYFTPLNANFEGEILR
ncbi:RAD55 family ATPase [Desulfonauticus submarinus]